MVGVRYLVVRLGPVGIASTRDDGAEALRLLRDLALEAWAGETPPEGIGQKVIGQVEARAARELRGAHVYQAPLGVTGKPRQETALLFTQHDSDLGAEELRRLAFRNRSTTPTLREIQ